MHRHQLALYEGEKEGSLSEVEVPPCWFSLSHRSPTCYLHEVPLVTTVGLRSCCRLKQVGRTTHGREVLGSRRIRQSTHQYPDRHDSMVRACLFSLDSCRLHTAKPMQPIAVILDHYGGAVAAGPSQAGALQQHLQE